MDQELFNQYFLDAKRWIKKSRELMISAHYLVSISRDMYLAGNEQCRPSNGLERHPFEAWASLGHSAALLVGLALENALKGHLVEKGHITINESGKITGLDGSHNLSSMLQQSNYNPTCQEIESINLLTFQLQSLSKYHIAKNPKKQADFTGRVDNPSNYYELATKIILQLIDGELRELYLNSDGSFEHIPRLPEFSETPLSERL